MIQMEVEQPTRVRWEIRGIDGDGADPLLVDVVENGIKETILVAEVVIDQPLVRVRLSRYPIDSRAGDAPLDELPRGRLEESLPGRSRVSSSLPVRSS